MVTAYLRECMCVWGGGGGAGGHCLLFKSTFNIGNPHTVPHQGTPQWAQCGVGAPCRIRDDEV